MNYDAQLADLKNLLPTAKNILIALPGGSNIDRLAAALALYLALEKQGKKISIVCEDTIKVGHAYLFGVDRIQKNIPQTVGGNLILTLEGVASSDGTIPSLEKLDWSVENNDLNLVFHVVPGENFQPTRIVPRYQGSGFNIIFTIGAASLSNFGDIFYKDQDIFSGVHLVNIDNNTSNTTFGQTNIVDTTSSSVSEMVYSILTSLGVALDSDIASNVISGIFDATNNLALPKVTADTYMTVASCLKAGGQKPEVNTLRPSIKLDKMESKLDLSALIPPDEDQTKEDEAFTTPSVINIEPKPERERTMGKEEIKVESFTKEPEPAKKEEGEDSFETPEPDWLTPKVFHGKSVN